MLLRTAYIKYWLFEPAMSGWNVNFSNLWKNWPHCKNLCTQCFKKISNKFCELFGNVYVYCLIHWLYLLKTVNYEFIFSTSVLQYFSSVLQVYIIQQLANLAQQVPIQYCQFGIVIRSNQNKFGNQALKSEVDCNNIGKESHA